MKINVKEDLCPHISQHLIIDGNMPSFATWVCPSGANQWAIRMIYNDISIDKNNRMF